MREVIAKRKNSLFGVYGGVTVVGLILLFIMLGTGETWDDRVWGVIAALMVVAVGLGMMISIALTPKEAIVLEGDTLHFAGKFSCKVSEVTKAVYRQAHARGIAYQWGKIIVFVGDKKVQYNFIENVEDVQLKLLALARPKAEED